VVTAANKQSDSLRRKKIDMNEIIMQPLSKENESGFRWSATDIGEDYFINMLISNS
jgi:hypothetical protein